MEFKADPKFSVIVPVHNVPPDVFKRCLTSIADQDYGNLEVVIVPNNDPEADKMAREFSEGREHWKVVYTEEKGACQARNLGFNRSSGEIVAFINSDYILNPGIVRSWVDSLEKHPDCGFVYGAYEYRGNQRDVYWSKPFDSFQLEVANFIDCGFPLWRKHVVEWDSEVKSLQDWDFWLRVVKSGVKGHYLGREISYVAEYPRKQGLSEDSTNNWLERVKFIKEKNGIPLRDTCVVSLGAPNHGAEIAKMIGADFRDDTLHKPHDYKTLYLIGWYMKPGEAQNGHHQVVKAFPNSVRILHFVGADIYWLRYFSYEKIRQWAGAMKLTFHHILCENELAQKELAGYGIEAEIVPIPPYSDFKCQPLPKDFTVALYLARNVGFDKYCLEPTLSIVKAMPDVKFIGYGDAEIGDFKAKNFENRGLISRKDYEKLVLDCSAYLRLVRHDTRPLASDEFVMAGRSVITNIPNEYMDVIDTSGIMPFDQWDTFGPGFAPIRWPETKKLVVQKIREVKKRQKASGNEFEGERLARSIAFNALLNKDRYREKLRDLSKAVPVALEVVA